MSDLDAFHWLWTETDVRQFLFDDRQITNEEQSLGLKKVEADVDEPGKASIRMESLGMSRTCRAIVNERPLLYYEAQT